jgi:prevent-host-death family protein
MTATPPAEVTATDFRANIAEILTNAKYGHPTVITNNAKPIAKVVHPDADDGELDALKAAVQHLAAEAHRRKWVWEDTNPGAFEELHRLGNELLAALGHCPDSAVSHEPEGATK